MVLRHYQIRLMKSSILTRLCEQPQSQLCREIRYAELVGLLDPLYNPEEALETVLDKTDTLHTRELDASSSARTFLLRKIPLANANLRTL